MESYALPNQKGGVRKTTVTVALGAALARRGERTLVVDLDPQASATKLLGIDVDEPPESARIGLGSRMGIASRCSRWRAAGRPWLQARWGICGQTISAGISTRSAAA